jgi:2-haloacid dehalogenase
VCVSSIKHMDFSRFQALTFDCYGTLIDWETGIFSALKPILAAHGKSVSDAELLEHYAELEATAEAGEYRSYREVLHSVVRDFGERLMFTPSEKEVRSLPDSVPTWKPFPDTIETLQRLKGRYRLFVISNIDDDLFDATKEHLPGILEGAVTAQQARSYKPSLHNFRMALDQLSLRPEHVLHVGQSIYHDVIPAKSLGIATAWVNRPSPRPNAGAARAAEGQPDLEVASLAALAGQALN